ncbi:MAG: hypothetical protein Q7T83_07240 [Thermodesulfovibrionales bacterium]|nr:hypothetical protein [Thermodesulfovibrionales bacterium]
MKNQIKYLQNLFYDLLNDYGRVFIIVKYSDRTALGNRKFTDEEKEKGLILVFNNRNSRTIQWAEDGSIVTTLGFGVSNKPENCFLHCDDIVAVYSPDAKVKVDRWDMLNMEDSSAESRHVKGSQQRRLGDKKKVVSLDNFRKAKT